MRRLVLLFSLWALLWTAAAAQEAGRTILVLDASNSMWGQIAGEAKITIARRVVGDLLASLPGDQELGLTLYGHRREGDCTDIETVVPPGPGTRDAIAAAVNAAKPKGKTPMTDAVIAAAEALGYRDQPATVILVSDGVETCAPDPCAAAAALEAAGAAFTAHVIGFDITDEIALGQMRCLAEGTGGTFRPAADADELAAALAVVAAPPAPPPPPPPPAPAVVTFTATLGANGPDIGAGLTWTLSGEAGIIGPGGGFTRELPPGDYSVTVARAEDGASAATSFTLGTGARLVTLVLPEIARTASLSAAAEAPVGATIPVTWQAEATDLDYITVAEPGQGAAEYRAYVYTRDGSPAMLRLPLDPGTYDLRYIRSSGEEPDRILATVPITLTGLTVTLAPPSAAGAGSTVPVAHTGPDYDGDYLTVARPDQGSSEYLTYAYTSGGSPVALTMPNEAGDYEIRYVAAGFPERIMARVAIRVAAVAARLDAPADALQGSTIAVAFTGPANPGDYLDVARADQADHEYLTYVYADQGNPAALAVPLAPGDYVIRYVAAGNAVKVLARRPLTVTAAEMALDAPATAVAGSTLSVAWQGPGNRGDYLSVAPAGAGDGEYRTYVYADQGNPAALAVPVEPGEHELRYVGSGYPEMVLARRPLSVTPVSAAITGPSSGKAGSAILVDWEGPAYRSDYLAIGRPGERAYADYAYAEYGSPAELTLPEEPGLWELRYVLGQGEVVIATLPFTVE
jgi:Ca-activated chloride channel family protein